MAATSKASMASGTPSSATSITLPPQILLKFNPELESIPIKSTESEAQTVLESRVDWSADSDPIAGRVPVKQPSRARFLVSRVSEEALQEKISISPADFSITSGPTKSSETPDFARKSQVAETSATKNGDEGSSAAEPFENMTNRDFQIAAPAAEAPSDKPEREPFVFLGVCAMAKKAKSKYMTEILTRITSEFEQIKTIIFEENQILNDPVEQWPQCDALISFYSGHFPLDKAIQYAELRQPFLVNDLQMQYAIQDRRKVYELLKSAGVDLPRYAVLDRESPEHLEANLEEFEDYIIVNGQQFNKPFVEKPICADDHNVYIYYPSSAGSGSQRLFRKISTRSSVYSNESRVRMTGSYIYEEFMPTDGTDVKVYTVGPEYAHAEARKSPALDGIVERDKEGKELRFPIILNNIEKLISRRVCTVFKQIVCGFDLLRANGRSYVCDVNGFSFVKNSMIYYNDFAKILANLIMRRLAPELHIRWSMPYQLEDPPIVPTTIGRLMELRCVVAVVRHGDRTPKQKLKMELRHAKFLDMFRKFGGNFLPEGREIKLKKPSQLQEVLDVVRDLLTNHRSEPVVKEKRPKLIQLKSVLEMYGHFSGINRKVQIKYQIPDPSTLQAAVDSDCLEADMPRGFLVLIMKWGGELTPLGKYQSEQLGQMFRCMYPGSGEVSAQKGHGLLRLHSTFRHDLKIYASDEGRVQTTAAAFAKGLLALEGELTPILVQMVKSADTNGLLDSDLDARDSEKTVKKRLKTLLTRQRNFLEEDYATLNPSDSLAIKNAMDAVKNPVFACEEMHQCIKDLNLAIREKATTLGADLPTLYTGESWELLQRRWRKLEKDFRVGDGDFDITKLPDIYDCIRFDMHHNQWIGRLPCAKRLFSLARNMSDIVVPLEYGITANEKLAIAQGICSPLLRKIKADLNQVVNYTDDAENINRLHPRESHIHSLVNILKFGGLFTDDDPQWSRARDYLSAVPELNFLTQIVIMLYEDTSSQPESDQRFHVELHFSSGMQEKTGDREAQSSSVVDSRRGSVQDQAVDALALESAESSGLGKSFLTRQPSIAHLMDENTDSSATINYPKTKRDRFITKVKETGVITNRVFRTAVIRGLMSVNNNTAVGDPDDESMCFRVPNVKPLETLHNALSFRQLDNFLQSVLNRSCKNVSTLVERSRSMDDSLLSVALSTNSWVDPCIQDQQVPETRTSDLEVSAVPDETAIDSDAEKVPSAARHR